MVAPVDPRYTRGSTSSQSLHRRAWVCTRACWRCESITAWNDAALHPGQDILLPMVGLSRGVPPYRQARMHACARTIPPPLLGWRTHPLVRPPRKKPGPRCSPGYANPRKALTTVLPGLRILHGEGPLHWRGVSRIAGALAIHRGDSPALQEGVCPEPAGPIPYRAIPAHGPLVLLAVFQ